MAIEKRYWDSDIILCWLKKEPRWGDLRGTIEAAEDGRVKIVTSTWTLTEVIRLTGRELNEEDDAKIVDFFAGEYIHLRAVSARVGHMARRYSYELYEPKDAIHVAQAVDAGCDRFDTFDSALTRSGPPDGTTIKFGTPDLARQGSLDDIELREEQARD